MAPVHRAINFVVEACRRSKDAFFGTLGTKSIHEAETLPLEIASLWPSKGVLATEPV